MTLNSDHKTGMHSVDGFAKQLSAAGRRRSTRGRRLRRVALPFAGVAALGAGTLAVAGEFGASSEPRVIGPGKSAVIGFEDPDTGEALRCPDGTLFTLSVPANRTPDPPVCADGSVPLLYSEYEKRSQEFFEKAGPGDSLADGPALPTFEVDPGEK